MHLVVLPTCDGVLNWGNPAGEQVPCKQGLELHVRLLPWCLRGVKEQCLVFADDSTAALRADASVSCSEPSMQIAMHFCSWCLGACCPLTPLLGPKQSWGSSPTCGSTSLSSPTLHARAIAHPAPSMP